MSFVNDVYNVYDGLEISLLMLNPNLNEVIMSFAEKIAETNDELDPLDMKDVFVERVVDHFARYVNTGVWFWDEVAVDLLACAAMELAEEQNTK